MKKVVSLHSQTNGIARRRSSAVEHVICNLGVGGPNPSAGSKEEDEISPSFFYSCGDFYKGGTSINYFASDLCFFP